MDFRAWVKKIKQTSMLLDLLMKDVGKATTPKPSQYRRIPFFVNIETTFESLDYTQRERTWFNGAEDVFLQGVAMRVAGDFAFFGSEDHVWTPPAAPGVVVGSPAGTRTYFDFGWNFRTSNTGALYLTPANGSALLSSTVLRKQRRDNYLFFAHPKRVKAGDVLVTQVKPLRFPQTTPSTSYNYTVSLTFFGYRNGALHVRS